jgi:hypothetical protein
LDGELPECEANDHADHAKHVATSAAAFHALAKNHGECVRRTTADRLNKQGNKSECEVYDRVKACVPPTQK